MTLGVSRSGIELAAVESKSDDLERWLVVDVSQRLSGRVLRFDEEAADRWGRLEASARRSAGRLPWATA